MNSRGTEPPTISLTNSNPSVRDRLEAHLDVTVLTLTARLPDELALGFRLPRDRFAIRDLRLADVGGDVELAHHAVDDDLEVQLTHAADDGLVRFRVRVDLERRVFLHELRERDAHLFLVDLGLRLDGDGDDRLRERHRLEDDRLVPVADRVAGGDAAQTDGGADVARPHFLDLFALVRVHLQQAADALGVALGRVEHGGARLDVTGVDAEERQLADERVGHDLEDERRRTARSSGCRALDERLVVRIRRP